MESPAGASDVPVRKLWHAPTPQAAMGLGAGFTPRGAWRDGVRRNLSAISHPHQSGVKALWLTLLCVRSYC
ncbi:hypothetical protein [Kamptonema formosum]|uniref:hypothetical protein n=1 Tax=Kamptonema formosum TaxID=331992 RepID=UPI0012DEF707|nr:hypothetical protein [Oscillatoria sp. PCC 10802]